MRSSTISMFFALLTFSLPGCKTGKSTLPPKAKIEAQPAPPPVEQVPSTPTLLDQALSFEQKLRPTVIAQNAHPFTLQERMQAHHVPGVAVAIIEDGKVVAAQGYGVLQAGKNNPVNADTLFSAGSISKLITAASVLALRDQGALDLDQDIQSYLRSWKLPPHPSKTSISLRMLLSHTSGLNLPGFADLGPKDPLPTLLQSIQGLPPAKNKALARTQAAGQVHMYSGGGYLLTQLVLEDLSQKPFAQLAQTLVFGPLEMSSSSFAQPLPANTPNVAKAHGAKGQPRALPRGYESMPELAASGLWTSAKDLAKLVAALLSEQSPLSASTRRSMLTRVAPGSHGLGPRLDQERDQHYFYHAGANESYKAWIEGNPSTGQGLVVLTNAQHGDRLYVEIRNAVADAMNWPINRPFLLDSKALPNAWTAQFTGQYQRPASSSNPALHSKVVLPYSLRVELKGQDLRVGAAQGGPTLKLSPQSPSLFVVPDWSVRTGVTSLEFHRNASNQVIGATVRVGNERSYFSRQQTPKP